MAGSEMHRGFLALPFPEGSIGHIISGNYSIPDEHPFSEHLLAMLKRCLTVNPKKRADIDALLECCGRWKVFLAGDKSIPADPATKPASRKLLAPPKGRPHFSQVENSDPSDDDETGQQQAARDRRVHTEAAGGQVRMPHVRQDSWDPFNVKTETKQAAIPSKRTSGTLDEFSFQKQLYFITAIVVGRHYQGSCATSCTSPCSGQRAGFGCATSSFQARQLEASGPNGRCRRLEFVIERCIPTLQ